MVGLLAGLEHTQHQGRKEHCPVTCLGRGHHQFSFDPVNLTHHPQGAGAEIQVIPLECQALPWRRPVASSSSGISTFISLGLADDSLHPSEGLQKIRFPPPLYSVLHEGRFECPGQSGTELRRRVLPAVACRFFGVCINPETAEPFPLVNSQDARDPPAADKYECFCSCGSQEGKSRECFYPR